VQLAGSGAEVSVADELVRQVCPTTGPPEVRAWWPATTTDYSPVVVLAFELGVVVTGDPCGSEEGRVVPVAVTWEEIVSVRGDERAWMLLVTTVAGRDLRLLLASLATLRAVTADLARRCAAACGPVDVRLADAGSSGHGAARQAHGPHRSRGFSRSRAHDRLSSAAEDPALGRIEARLATVELILAGLTGSSGRDE
jgi:hypothetical protein